MTSDEASKRIVVGIHVTPEDVARAKDYILRSQNPETDVVAGQWMSDHVGTLHRSFPVRIERPPLTRVPQTDLDLFLQGAPSLKLPPGIVEGIRQALVCFQRGLYLPAIVMLAAATEATWIECARPLAAKVKDKKLRDATTNPFAGFGLLVDLRP